MGSAAARRRLELPGDPALTLAFDWMLITFCSCPLAMAASHYTFQRGDCSRRLCRQRKCGGIWEVAVRFSSVT